MTTPTNIYGPVVLRTNATVVGPNFPGFTYAPGQISSPITSSFLQNELAARSFSGLNSTGITADYVSHLFFRNEAELGLYTTLISGFVPEYYIAQNKEIGLSLKSATGGITLSSGPGSGNDRFEVMQINYSTNVFLKDGGGTAAAITGITYSHSIYPGNTYVSANQIFYRKLGRISTT
jgi:hypothetical protein